MKSISLEDTLRVDDLYYAITATLQTVLPREGYLKALGVSQHDREVIDTLLAECWRDFESFESFKARTLKSEDINKRDMYKLWVPIWEREIAKAAAELVKR